MAHSKKAILKMSASILLASVALTPNVSISQNNPSPQPPTATTSPPADPPARTGPCATHIKAQKRADWNSDSYLCETAADIQVFDEIPQGMPGGVEKKIALPRGAVITKVHVYSDDKRVYGLKFSYKLRGGPTDDEAATEMIGGTGGVKDGEENIVELTGETPLHFIRPRFGPDPAGHYRTPVLVGLDIGFYKFNPLAPSYVADPAASFSHSDMIEVKRFGATGRGTPPVAPFQGFDVHLVQVIRGLNACVSPQDRNGRIFSLGVSVSGLGPRQTPNAAMCQQASNDWASQPLGPKKIVMDTLGRTDAYAFTRGVTDAQEFASGIYMRAGERPELLAGSAASSRDYRGARYHVPQTVLLDFGDQATVTFGDAPNTVLKLPLITDPARLTQNGTTFDFAYGVPGMFVGVDIQSATNRNTRRVKNYAYVTIETNDPNGRRFNGRYNEVRLGGQDTDIVAKRERARDDVRKANQSKAGLFSITAAQTGYGYVYAGYDPASMSPFEPNSGQRNAIFANSDEFQYHISGVIPKAVNDGLLLDDIGQGYSEKTVTILSSESEVASSLSRTIAADVNIRGVKASGRYTKANSSSLVNSQNSVIGFAVAQKYEFVLKLDRPNAFITDSFGIAMRRLYRATDAGVRKRFAEEIVNDFGTHFANAVIFGGMGTLMTEIDASTYASKKESSETISVAAGVEAPGKPIAPGKEERGPGNSGNASFDQTRTSTNNVSGSSSIDKAVWTSRGGGGGLGAEGWSVSPENSVPIYYDLRGIDELVEPLMMSKILESTDRYERTQIVATRAALRAAIESHFERFPAPSQVSNRRPLFKFVVKGLSCDNAGGDGLDLNSLFLGQGKEATGRIQLYGQFKVQVTSGTGNGETRDQDQFVFNNPDENEFLQCDSSIKRFMGEEVPIFTYSMDGTLPTAYFISDLKEDDDSFTDPDDDLTSRESAPAPREIGVVQTGRVMISGDMLSRADAGAQGRLQKPKVYINYEWVRLE